MKKQIITSTARRILTDWSLSHLDDIVKGGGVIDFSAMLVKLCCLVIHIFIIATLPASVFVVIYLSRVAEIEHLKSWVETIRKDRGFFFEHHYIEIKRHMLEHKEVYHLTLNWK